MLARLLENWPYKLLAIALAIGLRLYVQSQQSGDTTQAFPAISVNLKNIPATLVPDNPSPQTSVTLTGPPESLDTIALDPNRYIKAAADLRAAHSGINTDVPLQVVLSANVKDDVHAQDKSVDVGLEDRTTVTKTLRASVPLAPAGYAYLTPQVSPVEGTVSGPTSVIATVSRLVVNATAGESPELSPKRIDDYFPVFALDSRGNQISGVNVSPAVAHVIIDIANMGTTKSLLVSPNIVGSPAYPFQVQSIQVNPSEVVVSGPAATLSHSGIALTEPVDIAGAQSTVRKQVTLSLPAGVSTTVQPLTLDVTVTISKSITPPLLPNAVAQNSQPPAAATGPQSQTQKPATVGPQP